MKKVSKEEKLFNYRCPVCHYIVEKDILFRQCCPICGWVSPLVSSGKLNVFENSPHIDIFEDREKIRITTQLPIVDGNNIKIDVNSNKLLISSGEFNAIILLPDAVEHVIRKTYRNGVLDILLRKSGDENHG